MNSVTAASLVGLTTTGVGTGGGSTNSNSSSGEMLGSSGGGATGGVLVGNQGTVLASHLQGGHHHHHHPQHNHHHHSDEEDDEMPSSPESFDEEEVSYIGPDDVTAQLAAAGGLTGETNPRVQTQVEEVRPLREGNGNTPHTLSPSLGPVGVAAAAAIASAKKRKRHHCFELNPSIRKRQMTRLLRKLKATIDEYSTRVGQQAVVVVATPSKTGNNFKCFGAKPLEDVMKSLRQMVMTELENALAQQAPPPPQDDPSLHELPPLVVDGIPTPVEKMTQAQLRAFIPLMLKYSTGRGKPGWGKESTRPLWWPKDVPWANVRMDARSEDQKQKVSWTMALRQIVVSCYKYHGRDDLLPAFSMEEDKTQLANTPNASNSVYAGSVVQTISNPDGTVSIIHVDPSNPVIQLSEGSGHVQGLAQMQEILSGRKKGELTTQNGESVESDGGTVAIDINQVSDSSLSHEGTIIFTGEDGTQIPVNLSGSYPVSGMITLPLPVYQTVVANIQGADGQHLQVVTPLVQVPKMEPGLDAGVEVPAALNATLDASTIITSAQGHGVQGDDDDGETMELVEQGKAD